MKRFLYTVIFILLVSSIANAVPYPYREYNIDITEKPNREDLDTKQNIRLLQDMVLEEYLVRIKSEDGITTPWCKFSSMAVLKTAEYYEIDAILKAHDELFTKEEYNRELELLMDSYVNKSIHFEIRLSAEKRGVPGLPLVDTSEDNTALRRFVLETDKGERYLPIERLTTTTPIWGDQSNMSMSSLTSLQFPRYDGDVQIITEDTAWIKLWYITDFKRVYFQFNFEH